MRFLKIQKMLSYHLRIKFIILPLLLMGCASVKGSYRLMCENKCNQYETDSSKRINCLNECQK